MNNKKLHDRTLRKKINAENKKVLTKKLIKILKFLMTKIFSISLMKVKN